MFARLTSALIIAAVGGFLTLIPVSGFAGSAQDAFKKLQGQRGGSDIKAGSSISSDRTTEESNANKAKAKKRMKDLLDKGSKKPGN